MPDQKISADPSATDLIGAIIPIVQSATNKQVTANFFWQSANGATLTGANVFTTTGANNVTFNQSALGSGNGFVINSTSTDATANTQTAFRVNQSGANATASQTTYSGYFSNTKTGTGSTNVGLYAEASGGSTNNGITIGAGNLFTQSGILNSGSGFQFQSAGVLRMLIASTGDVSIGSAGNNGRLHVIQSALSSSWIPSFRVDPGAHTSLTASTSFPNQVFSSATQTWVATAGTIASQKDTEFRAITHSAATSGTFTDLYNVFMEAPLVGGAATATRRYALGLGEALGITIGTTVTSALANTFSISARDSSLGTTNATLALYLEQTVEAIGTFTPSDKLRIWVNGIEYWIQLDAV